MITYEQLLMEADHHNLITKEKALPISKGRIKGNRIAINKTLTETEKSALWQKNWDIITPAQAIY